MRGYGQDAVSAEHNALSGLSRYFSSRISVNTAEKTLVTDHGSKSRLEDVTHIVSDTTLFAVQYTKARFNNEQRNYEVIGYINREEAWQVYAPKVRQAAEAFSGLYDMGKQQNSDFRQALFLLQARELALSSDLLSMLQFAYALYPESITVFTDLQESLDTLPIQLKNAQAQYSIAIHCINDDKLQIAATVREILTDLGFSVTANQEATRYVCALALTENKKELPAGIFFIFTYPRNENRIEQFLSHHLKFEKQVYFFRLYAHYKSLSSFRAKLPAFQCRYICFCLVYSSQVSSCHIFRTITPR